MWSIYIAQKSRGLQQED